MDAKQYRAYASGMSDRPDVVLHHSGSVRWSDTRQLVELGLMHSTESFEDFAAGRRGRGGKPRPALQIAP
jgi:hypothetical protein